MVFSHFPSKEEEVWYDTLKNFMFKDSLLFQY